VDHQLIEALISVTKSTIIHTTLHLQTNNKIIEDKMDKTLWGMMMVREYILKVLK
jgi:hypothetical protein